ncbi:hypothetical protein QQZ08_010453 [Neonectria magnoliae]|uniref:Uncharacterized protein n=1 Tax=Neonectria magnoliae TaxID=2732573 RepID=A0ABR1HHE0_9HYPO
MYIPSLNHRLRVSVAQERLSTETHADSHPSHSDLVSMLCRHGLSPLRFCTETRRGEGSVIHRRQFSDNPAENNNIKIGLIVGILLAAFIAVVVAFLYFYGRSIRFTAKRRRHHHRRHKSYGSKSSRSSDGGPPPPRPPPPRSAPPPSPPPPRSPSPAPPPKEKPEDG